MALRLPNALADVPPAFETVVAAGPDSGGRSAAGASFATSAAAVAPVFGGGGCCDLLLATLAGASCWPAASAVAAPGWASWSSTVAVFLPSSSSPPLLTLLAVSGCVSGVGAGSFPAASVALGRRLLGGTSFVVRLHYVFFCRDSLKELQQTNN